MLDRMAEAEASEHVLLGNTTAATAEVVVEVYLVSAAPMQHLRLVVSEPFAISQQQPVLFDVRNREVVKQVSHLPDCNPSLQFARVQFANRPPWVRVLVLEGVVMLGVLVTVLTLLLPSHCLRRPRLPSHGI